MKCKSLFLFCFCLGFFCRSEGIKFPERLRWLYPRWPCWRHRLNKVYWVPFALYGADLRLLWAKSEHVWACHGTRLGASVMYWQGKVGMYCVKILWTRRRGKTARERERPRDGEKNKGGGGGQRQRKREHVLIRILTVNQTLIHNGLSRCRTYTIIIFLGVLLWDQPLVS